MHIFKVCKEKCCNEDPGKWYFYFFGKRNENSLTCMLNIGILNFMKLKYKRIRFLFNWYFVNRKVPFRIAYILEKNVLCLSEKDYEILEEWKSRNLAKC